MISLSLSLSEMSRGSRSLLHAFQSSQGFLDSLPPLQSFHLAVAFFYDNQSLAQDLPSIYLT